MNVTLQFAGQTLRLNDAGGRFVLSLLSLGADGVPATSVQSALEAEPQLRGWAAYLSGGELGHRGYAGEPAMIREFCELGFISLLRGDTRLDESESLVLSLLARMRELEELRSDFDRRLDEEKFQAMKELAYGASHEINNPLANISSRAQTLIRDEADPERRRILAVINRQAFRAHEMIADMMLVANPPELDLSEVRVQQIVVAALDELQEMMVEQSAIVRRQFDDGEASLIGDAVQLTVAVRALVRNALEAVGQVGDGGHVDIRTTRRGGEFVEIQIEDDGPGFDDRCRRHLFDPFFSGREAGRGLGFGLPKARTIVEQHGGTLQFLESDRTTFVMSLPLAGPGRS